VEGLSLRDQPGLYFWHIPKTAGMSVWKWLEPHYSAEIVYRPHLLPDLLQSAAGAELRDKRLFRGHFVDAPLQLVRPRLTTITLLREPVARSLSHLAHVERAPDHPQHDRVRSYGGDVDGLLSDPVLRRMLQDFQCRYLALHHVPEREPEDAAAWVVPPSSPLRAMMAFEMAPLPRRRALVVRALARLGRMDHVGVSEHLARFMRNVAADQGWPAPAEVPRENTRLAEQTRLLPDRLTASQRAVLAELTRADRIVYRAALAKVLATRPRRRSGPGYSPAT
jgi:hypothetical protein